MKNISKIAVVVASAAIALSGCSADTSEPKNSGQTTKSAETTPDASSDVGKNEKVGEASPEVAVTKFFKELHKNSSDMNESAMTISNSDGVIATSIGVDNADAIFTSSNPIPIVDGFSPEIQNKTAAAFMSVIPESVPVSYEDLSDSQIVLAAVSLMTMGASMGSLGPDESPVKPITTEDVEYSSDNAAKVSYYQSGADPDAQTENYLEVVKTNMGWFVDATYFYEMVSENM